MILRISKILLLFVMALILLIPDAIAKDKAQQKGAVLYLPLNEGSGNIAKDFSGKGNNGTLFGGPKWVTGKHSMGLYLDGKDDYIETPGILGEEGTIEFWFKPDWDGSDSEDYRLFDASAGDKYFFISKGANHADITPQYFGFYFEDGTDADWQDIEFDPVGTIKAKEWYHIAVTWKFNGGFGFLYINGKETATSARAIGPMPTLYPNPRFGLETIKYVPSRNGAVGVIDEIIIYSRALTANEIVKDMTELRATVETLGKVTSMWGDIKIRNIHP